jgi:serine/threonine protein kinase
MRNFFQATVLFSVIMVVGAALFVFFTDKKIIILNDDTLKTVDETWLSGDSLFYEIDGQIDFLDNGEIKTYGKRNIRHVFLGVKGTIIDNLNRMENGINPLLKRNHIPIELNLTHPLTLLPLFLFLLIMVFLRHVVKPDPKDIPKQKFKDLSQEPKNEVPTRLDIVRFFLNLFKYQIGAEPDAPTEFVPLMSKNTGSNHIYELRVKHMEDWTKRRMTIGPLGEESGSKSKCYYVIYDVHMVIKIPSNPIGDFEEYIDSIKKEVHIVNKLIPKECIIPKVSVILGLIHSFPYSEDIPPERLEVRYINWLRKSTEYQKFLKINNTFVFMMDLSKYYFLSHILDELHDIKNLIAREIIENAPIIWEPAKFKGRYGTEHDAIVEIRGIFNHSEADIRRLLDKAGVRTSVPIYQIQSWFYTHLAANHVTADADGFPDKFIIELNRLLKKSMQDSSKAVDVYRKIIKDYIYGSSFEQNKPQVEAVTANLLDILAWFREKRVSMRDLKPDNLFVAGDPARYPLFLKSAQEFSIGIIDVETAVDFEKSKYKKIKQPMLGGTPFYATPSHFIKNDVLIYKFKNLGKILHLQDWHATLIMIYKVITGDLLFEQTARLFGEIRNLMVKVNRPGGHQTDVFEEASRIFWHSAFSEFQVKIAESEKSLKAVVVDLTENIKYMFDKTLTKEKKSIVKAIKKCVDSQNIFEKDHIHDLLLRCSYAKTCQFKADLEIKAKRSGNLSTPRTEAITFLHKLADLKALFGQHVYVQKLLSQPELKMSAYDLLTFMFNVVFNNMYRSEWAPLFGEAVIDCDMPNEETIIEETQ